jgi:hypothetical protein
MGCGGLWFAHLGRMWFGSDGRVVLKQFSQLEASVECQCRMRRREMRIGYRFDERDLVCRLPRGAMTRSATIGNAVTATHGVGIDVDTIGSVQMLFEWLIRYRPQAAGFTSHCITDKKHLGLFAMNVSRFQRFCKSYKHAYRVNAQRLASNSTIVSAICTSGIRLLQVWLEAQIQRIVVGDVVPLYPMVRLSSLVPTDTMDR